MIKKTYTIQDIYAFPDGQRAELIDGNIYMMAPPTTRHQLLAFSLARKIADYIDKNKGKCQVLLAPFAVFLNEEKNYVEPDISVICDPDKIDDDGCHGAPDWIIEIVSPESRRMDYMIKLFKYRSGYSLCCEIWLGDQRCRDRYGDRRGSFRCSCVLDSYEDEGSTSPGPS